MPATNWMTRKSKLLKFLNNDFNYYFLYHLRLLENRRKGQRIVESNCGIIHEETFLRLGVLPQYVYNRFHDMKMKSVSPSVLSLAHWLGFGSIRILRDIVWYLKKYFPKSSKPQLKVVTKPVLMANEPVDEEVLNEEEWDKEDVDEIQGKIESIGVPVCASFIKRFCLLGQRMTDDGDTLFNFAYAKKKKLSKPEFKLTIHQFTFSICTQMLDDEMSSLLLALEDPTSWFDYEPAQSRIAEIQQQKHFLSEILEILPDVDTNDYKQIIEKDLGRLSYVERWKLYSYWRAETLDILAAEVNSLNVRVLQQKNELNDVETLETAEMVRQVDVVGITTTGAAKNKALLEHLKSKIGTVCSFIYLIHE